MENYNTHNMFTHTPNSSAFQFALSLIIPVHNKVELYSSRALHFYIILNILVCSFQLLNKAIGIWRKSNFNDRNLVYRA